MPDKDGRIRPNTKKQKARSLNTQIFGRASDKTETSGDYAVMKNKLLPKTHTDMRNVFAHVNAYIEQLTGNNTPGISSLHRDTIIKLYNVAMREPFDDVAMVKCPLCKKEHLITCPHCESDHVITIPSAQMEKNSITALAKLADKVAPNLAAITQDINVNFLVSNMAEFFTKTIVQYVPIEKRTTVMQDFHATMNRAVAAEYEEVPNEQD